ncbi:MAG: hypothetical protein RL180_1617 [Pseudomonadota bacterium]|jgi:hypothetical protein
MPNEHARLHQQQRIAKTDGGLFATQKKGVFHDAQPVTAHVTGIKCFYLIF